ncbi:MAG: TlpA family protein disulfide reductase [Bacteroidia bacterium]
MKKLFWLGLLCAQKVELITFEGLMYHVDTSRLSFVNFWATWCRPCVEELPLVRQAQQKYPQVQWVLVSLDFPEEKKRVARTLAMKELSHTFLLKRSDDAWIDKVHPLWAGNLPASALYQGGKQIFFRAGPLSAGLLDSLVQRVLR